MGFDWRDPYGYYNQAQPFPFGYGQQMQMPQNYAQPQQQQQQAQGQRINTNKIFVNGIEGAKQLQLPNNSCVLACDNDLDLVYEISVDGTGKRTITAFEVLEYKEAPKPAYVTQEEFSGFKAEIQEMLKGVNGAKE